MIKKAISWIMNHFSWWVKWFGEGTDDDWRNPFWRWTEARAITVTKTLQTFDFRFGYNRKSDGKWIWFDNRKSRDWVSGIDANFYNGIFTFSRTKTEGINKQNNIVSKRRFNLIIRLLHQFWFAFGVGTLPDRGEFGWSGPWFFSYKNQLEHNPGTIAADWDEGSV